MFFKPCIHWVDVIFKPHIFSSCNVHFPNSVSYFSLYLSLPLPQRFLLSSIPPLSTPFSLPPSLPPSLQFLVWAFLFQRKNKIYLCTSCLFKCCAKNKTKHWTQNSRQNPWACPLARCSRWDTLEFLCPQFFIPCLNY